MSADKPEGRGTPRAPRSLHSLLEERHGDIDDAFARLIERRWGRHRYPPTTWPAIDLYEASAEYILVADIPGVAPPDIELIIEGRRVTLCGHRFTATFAREGHGVRVERSSGRFCRTLYLDETIDTGRVRNGYENGIYWARLPKRSHRAQPSPER